MPSGQENSKYKVPETSVIRGQEVVSGVPMLQTWAGQDPGGPYQPL